ncbi:MAG TPA: protoporphyrinogen oxidase [Mycobacteriales bacterium]|nr:protoporphyrinogen oxidase [Mycobacteriales bacterium]
MGTRVVVVGAGIAGLAAARGLAQRVPAGTEVLLVEGSDRIGGKLRVSPIAGVAVDEGAEAMLARAPEGVALATDVGLAGELTHPATTSASVLADGVPRPLPAGTVMGVPADADSVGDAGLFTAATLARIAAEPDLPGRPLGADEDVAVGELVADRLGREVVDRLVDPLLGGVYAGRADLLSLRATVPALADALADAGPTGSAGSLLRAVRRVRAAAPPAGGPVFATLRGGLGSLPGAVASDGRMRIRLGLPVREIHRAGSGFRLTAGPVPDPTYLDADAVVVAVPAAKAAGMLATVAPWATAELHGIDYASVAIVTLAYQGVTLPTGSGLLVPAGEGRSIKAVTFSSAKWNHLAGDGVVLLRGSVGRYGEERVLHRDDADLADLVAGEVAELTGLRADPVEARVTRWGGALPQYGVGHLDRVRRIKEAVSEVPGLAVCGAAYSGVGVPVCIRTAHQAVAQVLGFLSRGAESRYG